MRRIAGLETTPSAEKPIRRFVPPAGWRGGSIRLAKTAGAPEERTGS
jgi:hypothetical protein